MKEPKGTALQALKYADDVRDELDDAPFLRAYLGGYAEKNYPEFVKFCLANPDEPELKAADGTMRKEHYGADGKQPWDTIKEFGWGPAFAAGNVLKYLRRTKQIEDSRKKAKWYFDELIKFTNGSPGIETSLAIIVARGLTKELTRDELDVLGVPSCFRPSDR